MSVAGDAGTRNSEGVNRDAPEGIPPSSTGFREQLKGIAEQGGWRKLDIVEAPRGMVEGGGTAAYGLANGEDTGVGLASVADVGDEATKVHATNFSLDDQADHDSRDLVHSGG